MKPIKIFQVMIVLALMISTAIMADSAHAQSPPSVPQFTLQYVDNSYYVAPTYSTNPYTGETQVSSPGYTVQNRSLEMIIQNQGFSSYFDGNNTIQLYYNIRCKGHYEQFQSNTDLGSHGIGNVAASNSYQTIVSFNIDSWGVPVGGQVDFQVQAFIGYTYFNEGACFTQDVVTVGESAWSPIETYIMGSGTTSTSTPSPYVFNPTPTQAPYNPFTNYTNPYTNPTRTPTSIGTGAHGSVPFVSQLNWQEAALIVMAAVIAILLGILVSVIRWRKAAANR